MVMNKVYLFEKSNILKIRIEKMLSRLGFREIRSMFEDRVTISHFLKGLTSDDLLIIDFESYECEFDEILSYIQKNKKGQSPIIFVLVHFMEPNGLIRLFQRGVNDVLIKPFENEVFLNKINRLKDQQPLKQDVIIHEEQTKSSITLSWCSGYEIGVPLIDKEHKEIVNHFHRLYQFMKECRGQDYYKELITFLQEYVVRHFENEERLQVELHYPEYDNHRHLHELFRTRIQELVIKDASENVSNQDLIKLNLFIKDWLIHHIMVEDTKIGLFYKENHKNYKDFNF